MKLRFSFFFKFLPFLIFILFLSGCAAIPVSDEELSRVGAEVHKNIIDPYGEYEDPKVQTYVEGVGRRVEASSDYTGDPLTFTVLDTPVVNAFSVPGGYIHVTRGLITRVNSESEIAFVIGHEIGHLTARHSAQRISQLRTSNIFSTLLGTIISIYSEDYELGRLVANIVDFSSALVILNYGREAEFEADSLGLKFAYSGGYNPEAGMKFLRTLKSMEKSKRQKSALGDLLATHPPTEDRIKEAKDISKHYVSVEAEEGELDIRRNSYLKRIEGIVVGESLESGFIKDDVYYNKKYMFILRAAGGWSLITSRSYLGGLAKDKNNLFLVYAKIPESQEPLEQYAKSFLREVFDDKEYNPEFKTTSYLGLPALDFHTRRGRDIRALFFKREKMYYALVYSYNATLFANYNEVFSDLIGKFSFMSADVASEIWEDRMRIYKAQPGDTAESLSLKFYGNSKYRQKLMEYNGVVGKLDPGIMLKIPSAKYLED